MSTAAAAFYFPRQGTGSHVPTSSPALVPFCSFGSGHPDGCEVVSVCCLALLCPAA